MVGKAKQPAKRRAIAKRAARRKVAKKQGPGLKSVKKTARAVVKSAGKKTTAAKKGKHGLRKAGNQGSFRRGGTAPAGQHGRQVRKHLENPCVSLPANLLDLGEVHLGPIGMLHITGRVRTQGQALRARRDD